MELIILQKDHSFIGCTETDWNSYIETDILELGERVTTGLDDEARLGGSSALYWWRSQGWRQ